MEFYRLVSTYPLQSMVVLAIIIVIYSVIDELTMNSKQKAQAKEYHRRRTQEIVDGHKARIERLSDEIHRTSAPRLRSK